MVKLLCLVQEGFVVVLIEEIVLHRELERIILVVDELDSKIEGERGQRLGLQKLGDLMYCKDMLSEIVRMQG